MLVVELDNLPWKLKARQLGLERKRDATKVARCLHVSNGQNSSYGNYRGSLSKRYEALYKAFLPRLMS